MYSTMFVWLILFGLFFHDVSAQQYFGNYYCRPGRDVVVHLFEWKWRDIEKECAWLAMRDYCAVQVSPVHEHRLVTSPDPVMYPWYQRYQPVSYQLGSRGGTEIEFRSMVNTCNNLGVYIYVDGVYNHMSGEGNGTGSGGCSFDWYSKMYPCVPYGPGDFNGPAECTTDSGTIESYQDANQIRNCMLNDLVDLKQWYPHVNTSIVDFMNRLVGWGVAGFRIDAAKHMWPNDLAQIYGGLNDLNTQWFPANRKPYIFQEVIDLGGEAVTAYEYTPMGRVTEFKHCKHIGDVFRGNKNDRDEVQKLAYLVNYGTAWDQLPSDKAFIFVDNHDNQRGHGAGGFGSILTFFDSSLYTLATAFELAWDYGHARLMSSYNWPRNIVGGQDTNDWIGPPSDPPGTTKDVVCSARDNATTGEFVCEHRWFPIANMVRFHNAAMGYPVTNWWDNGENRIAFERYRRAFIVINNEPLAFSMTFNTTMPPGQYCDVIKCDNKRPPCGNSTGQCGAGQVLLVDLTGQLSVTVPAGYDSMIAIHV